MSESKHTPGPWRVRLSTPEEGYYCWWIYDADDREVTTVDGRDEANARLIASAPDLLAALKAFPGFTDDATIGDKWIETMRAAIAKAEGQQ